jgi:O-6-methylguanine DNA methyltransferase
MAKFTDRVLNVVRGIPSGQTMTYAQVAQAAGNPGAVRAVGTLMKKNFDPTVPCHRVIRSDGSVGEYNRGGPEAKARLLRWERDASTSLG